MTDTNDTARPPIGDAHRRLNVFVGDWHTDGTSFADGQTTDDTRASGVPWKSDEHYEWLPGGFFQLHRWDAAAGTREFKGTEIIGYDEANGGYFTRFFDNAGFHPEYTATVDGDVWTITEPSTQATVTIRDAGQHIGTSGSGATAIALGYHCASESRPASELGRLAVDKSASVSMPPSRSVQAGPLSPGQLLTPMMMMTFSGAVTNASIASKPAGSPCARKTPTPARFVELATLSHLRPKRELADDCTTGNPRENGT